MGVANSREYSCYHAPDTPCKVVPRGKQRCPCGAGEMFPCLLGSQYFICIMELSVSVEVKISCAAGDGVVFFCLSFRVAMYKKKKK